MAGQAKDGDTVRVHYTGKLESGEVFDSSEERGPFEFVLGEGQAIPGFEDGIRGMEVGETRHLEIESDDAYGPRRDELVQAVSRQGMNLDVEPEEGMNLIMQLPDGNQIPVAITEVTETHVTLDANHPLAGQKLSFDVTLIDKSSSEE